MTTTSRSVCPTCGTIERSGKSSCCGRGGSWFRNCGSAGNTKLRQTWYEGILACKTRAQLKTVRAQQLKFAQQSNSSHGTGMGNSKAVITAAETFTFTPANTPTPMSIVNAPTTTPDKKSITTSARTSFINSSAAILTTLTTTATAITTGAIAPMTKMSHTVKEATVAANWISQGMCYECDISIKSLCMHIALPLHLPTFSVFVKQFNAFTRTQISV